MRLLLLLALALYLAPSLVAYSVQISPDEQDDVAHFAALKARQEITEAVTTTSTASNEDATTSTTNAPTTTSNPTSTGTTTVATTTGTASTSTESTTTASKITASTITGSPTNSTTFSTQTNSVPPGELPLQPKVTPAIGVAGVILIGFGLALAFIGTRITWVQIFLSVSCLIGLAVAVLIIYVSDPPVSDAIQGAYLVAVFFSGITVGGIALLFQELTEGVGCLLGGFCFSMWLLVMKSGGLITQSGGRIGLIVALSAGSYALSFSHYTRPYGLMASTAFAGGTAFVLGVDCYTRAGLKEFWLYIWDLNGDTFRLGTNTYPLKRNIRVEIGVVVIVAIFGVMCQLRLWNVVRKRRLHEREYLDEEQRKKDESEAEMGRKFQDDNMKERAEWEAMYGSGPETRATSTTEIAELHDSKKGNLPEVRTTEVNAAEGDTVELDEVRASGCGEIEEIENYPAEMSGADCTQPQHHQGASKEQEYPDSDEEAARPETPASFRFFDRVAAAADANDDGESDVVAMDGSEVGTTQSTKGFSRTPLFRRFSWSGRNPTAQSKEALLSPGDCESDSNSSIEAIMDDVSILSHDRLSDASSIHSDRDEREACYARAFSENNNGQANGERTSTVKENVDSGETADNQTGLAISHNQTVNEIGDSIDKGTNSEEQASRNEENNDEAVTKGPRKESNDGDLKPNRETEHQEANGGEVNQGDGEETAICPSGQEHESPVAGTSSRTSSKDEERKEPPENAPADDTLEAGAATGFILECLDSGSSGATTSSRESLRDRERKEQTSVDAADETQEAVMATAAVPEEQEYGSVAFTSSKVSSSAEDRKDLTDTAPTDGVSDQKSPSSTSKRKAKEFLERAELRADAVKRLPERSSKVIQSYRTNEWAKHLAEADTPGLEPITPLQEDHPEWLEEKAEVAAPVKSDELLQTPLNAQPPPALEVQSPGQESFGSNDRRLSSTSDSQLSPRQLDSGNGQHRKSSAGLSGISSTSTPFLFTTEPRRASLKEIRSLSNPQLLDTINSEAEDSDAGSIAKPKWTGRPPLMSLREDRVRSRLSLTSLGDDPWASRNKPGHSSVDLHAQHSPTFPIPEEDEEDLPLSQRRTMLQKQKSQSNRPSPVRGSQSFTGRANSSSNVMEAWRQSIREDLAQRRDPLGMAGMAGMTGMTDRRSTSFGADSLSLSSMNVQNSIPEGMQRGDMNDLHREALRRMQAAVYRRTSE